MRVTHKINILEEGLALMSVKSTESRRISSLLGQRRVSGTVMVAVLTAALLFGLIGFALHTLWIVVIVVLALGLGYVVANARQDRREAIDGNREDAESARDALIEESGVVDKPKAAAARTSFTRERSGING